MNDQEMSFQLLELVTKPQYKPLTLKGIARRLQLNKSQLGQLRHVARRMVREGKMQYGPEHVVLPPQRKVEEKQPSPGPKPTTTSNKQSRNPGIVGTLRLASGGYGFVKPTGEHAAMDDIFIPAPYLHGALSGDVVAIEIDRRRQHPKGPSGVVNKVVERATQQFVGSYAESESGQGFVTVSGENFMDRVMVGDARTKNAKPGDQVVVDMIRFPAPGLHGEAVIVEVLGKLGEAGVDTKTVIKSFGLPEAFPPEVLEEARQTAARFNEKDLYGRTDYTQELVITIDPPDAKDFDDALSLTFDEEKERWLLTVHIADVSHFCPVGSLLDREAQKRATSVYLPGKVIPMFPETISNHLASLQEGVVRFVQTVQIEFSVEGEPLHAHFSLGAIKVRKRFTYDEVSALLHSDIKQKKGRGKKEEAPKLSTYPSEIVELVHRLHTLAQKLRSRRHQRGSLELSMPEVVLEYDDNGDVIGAHNSVSDVSHQLVEECMLAANEAVAWQLFKLKVPFLRRTHPAPEPNKLGDYIMFVRSLGYEADRKTATDRFQLQRLLAESAESPNRHAVHFAQLRSLKQATYSPEEIGHYALASKHYCHFTSPIRRYPDLLVHRLLTKWISEGKVGGNNTAELVSIGYHCSNMERRADKAEEDLVRIRLLRHLEKQIGSVWEAFITHVDRVGFSCQPKALPTEGFVHVASMSDDYYEHFEDSHSLVGRRYKKRYRLGDAVTVEVALVDVARRSLAFRVKAEKADTPVVKEKKETGKKKIRKKPLVKEKKPGRRKKKS